MWYVDKSLSNLQNVQHRQVISSYLFTFITHKLWEHLVRVFSVSLYIFKVYFNNYDVRTLKIFNHIPKLYKAPNQSVAKWK